MKKYIKPSALTSSFEIEDIVMLSSFRVGGSGSVNQAPTQENNPTYYDYLQEADNSQAKNGWVEFYW